MNRFPRGLVAALALAMLVLLAGGAWFYRAQKQHIQREVKTELGAIAQLKVDQIVEWRTNQLEEAAETMRSPFFAGGVSRWMADPQAESPEDVLTRFRALHEHYHYRDVLLADAQGRVRMSLSGHLPLLCDETERALVDALRVRRPVLTDLHTGDDDPVPHLGAVAPLFVKSKGVSEPVGAVILQNDARYFLYPLIRSWPIPSRSAETLLVRRDGDAVLFLSDLRHQKDAELTLRIPLARTEVPAVRAVLGSTGVLQGMDYRGTEVLAVSRSIPDSPWFLVSKVDTEEAFSEWHSFSMMIMAMILVLVAAAVAVFGLVWQRNDKAHYRALFQAEAARRESEGRYRTTLMSVGDGVIATDSEGRVTVLNPVAEALTGWRQEEVWGKPIEEVFRIVNEESRRPVENPVLRVIRDGLVVGLANHTILVARDGTERPIADSGAPIHDENGAIGGAVLVFRDRSEERAARRRLQHEKDRAQMLASAIEQAGEAVIVTGPDGTIQFVNPAFERVSGYTREEAIGQNPRMLNSGEQDEAFYIDMWQALTSGQTWEGRLVNRKKDGSRYTEDVTISPVRNSAGAIVNYVAVKRDITEHLRLHEERTRLAEQYLQAQKMESVGRLAGGVAHDFNNMLQAILGNTEIALDEASRGSSLHECLLEIQKAARRSADLTRQLLAFARRQTVSPRVLDLNDTISGMLKMLQRLIGEDIHLSWIPGHGLWQVKMDPSQIDQILANLTVNARDAIAGVGRMTIETDNAAPDEAYCADHAECIPGEYVVLAVSDDGCGMSRETLNRIFEPFFTSKGVGQGTGLGLSTVYGIVKQNDGFVNVYSEVGKGTTFRIYLPRAESEAVEGYVAEEEPTPQGGTETVLIVEDEEAILKQGKRILERLGYAVLTAGTPGEAIQLAENHPGAIHLLISDVVMPQMNGRELSERLTAMKPELKCIYMSGYTANVIAHHGVLEEGVHFMQKPFSFGEMAREIREALG